MMTTTKTKSSDTTTATTQYRHANDDKKINNKLQLSSDSLSMLQRKLEATNKSILSALIQHEEEQKDEKKEMKMLHLLHELPLDTETNEELTNEAASNCSEDDAKDMVDDEETKVTDKDEDEDTTDADNVNVAVTDDDTVDSNKKTGESEIYDVIDIHS